MGAPADYEDSAAAAAAARCFPKPPAWVDPTLEELTASLVVTPLAGAPVAASQEVDASPLDTRSPAKTAQQMMDLALSLLVQGATTGDTNKGGTAWHHGCQGVP
jgi:hypothetical protein